MEPNMFCYQCQETAKGTGCILKGVCGKESHTAQAMDLLLFVVRGISVVADTLRKADSPNPYINRIATSNHGYISRE